MELKSTKLVYSYVTVYQAEINLGDKYFNENVETASCCLHNNVFNNLNIHNLKQYNARKKDD